MNYQYINDDGFVTVEPNALAVPGEGNGWLQTGLAFACGMYSVDNASNMLRLCQPISNPLIFRSPHKKNADDNETCDDYWGALPLDKEWAAEVLSYGRSHGWVFDVQERGGLEYRFDRFPAFTPFLKACAGEPLSRFDKLRLALTVVFDALFNDKADNNMAAYCRLKATEQLSHTVAIAAGYWRRRIRKRYGSIGASWAAYFGNEHPLVAFDEENI